MSGIAQCEVQGLTIAGGAGGTLTNGNWVVPVPVTIYTPTLATGGANQNSPGFFSEGEYWNGSASVADIWSIADILGSGTNPTTALTISHVSGTPGAASVNIVANLALTGLMTQYNGLTTQGLGLSAVLYSNKQTGLTANLNGGSAITLVTPASASVYRISVTLGITTAATVSSTTPSITLGWTDAGGIARTSTLIGTNSSNVTTAFGSTTIPIFTNGSTPVTITYAGYASSGATAMQYATSIQLEQIA